MDNSEKKIDLIFKYYFEMAISGELVIILKLSTCPAIIQYSVESDLSVAGCFTSLFN